MEVDLDFVKSIFDGLMPGGRYADIAPGILVSFCEHHNDPNIRPHNILNWITGTESKLMHPLNHPYYIPAILTQSAGADVDNNAACIRCKSGLGPFEVRPILEFT